MVIGAKEAGSTRTLGFIRRELIPAAQDPSRVRRYHFLIDEINRRHGHNARALLRLTDPVQLRDFVGAEVKDLFGPCQARLEPTENRSPYTRLIETSLRENRLIYVPSRQAQAIYVSGRPWQKDGRELSIYEVNPREYGLDPDCLPEGPESIVVAPLVSGLGSRRPDAGYPRHGALVATKLVPRGFDPSVDLPILLIIAHDIGRVVGENQISLLNGSITIKL